MIADKKRPGNVLSEWASPAFVMNATFCAYFIPVVFIVMDKGLLLENFAPVKIHYPGYCLAIFLINWVLLNVIFFAIPVLRVSFWPLFPTSRLRALLAWIYILGGLCSLAYLNARLGIPAMVIALLRGNLAAFAVSYLSTGVVLIAEHLLIYYFISNSLVVGLFMLQPSSPKGRINFRSVVLLLIVLDYLLISRREIVMLIGLIWLLQRSSKGIRIRRTPLFLGGLMLIAFVGIVNLRSGNSFLDVSSFLASQEFSPFQFGMYLVDRGVASFSIGQPLDLFTRIPIYTTLAARELANHFYYREVAGPTVSINHILFNFGYLPVCVYCALFFALCKSLYRKYLENRDPIFAILYGFAYVKMFVLIRNGELFIHYLDLMMFIALCSPFLVFGPKRLVNAYDLTV